jgi:hypothetical protein
MNLAVQILWREAGGPKSIITVREGFASNTAASSYAEKCRAILRNDDMVVTAGPVDIWPIDPMDVVVSDDLTVDIQIDELVALDWLGAHHFEFRSATIFERPERATLMSADLVNVADVEVDVSHASVIVSQTRNAHHKVGPILNKPLINARIGASKINAKAAPSSVYRRSRDQP